ncbi:DUF4142 domain-containing protein [Sphingobacterium paucimobilis]|uniref:DUF4142 domain-containing protein n=1 Tax=Sphingobacterium paucimobilis HER1398 TaxID=1346330 RepID=U2HPC3_9SPHI|nr:DUF4142 domain-containing protein [Sphingobacterium paucimobilis]ERJ57322.1 hypothetical protein M472_00945 [Sphingobacterium paucimobilis HER1398]
MNTILRTKLIIYYFTVLLTTSGLFYGCHHDNSTYNDNQGFINKAHSSLQLKIAAGNLAVQKGQADNIQDYGEEVVKEHSGTYEEIKEMAIANSWIVTEELLTTHQKKFSDLQEQEISKFDLAFAKLMVSSHEEVINLFQIASVNENGVYDTDVQTFARTTLPVLQSQLIGAKEILDQVDEI